MNLLKLITIVQVILLITGIFIALNDLSIGLVLLLICFILERIKRHIKKKRMKKD